MRKIRDGAAFPRAFFRLVHHVHDPRPNRLHQHLRAFALQEGKHVEVAIALGGLGPEFANDLHHRLDPQAVNFNRAQAFVTIVQHILVSLSIELLVYLEQGIENRFPAGAFVPGDAAR